MAAGGGIVYWKKWIRLRDAKKHTIKAFWWFKGDLISQWIPSFTLVTRVTRLIHNTGKYLLISIYPLPTHPTHNFTHKNGGNLDTLPGWPKKLHLNRPARCAGQLPSVCGPPVRGPQVIRGICMNAHVLLLSLATGVSPHGGFRALVPNINHLYTFHLMTLHRSFNYSSTLDRCMNAHVLLLLLITLFPHIAIFRILGLSKISRIHICRNYLLLYIPWTVHERSCSTLLHGISAP